MEKLNDLTLRMFVFLTIPPPKRDERGDVPGWVLVTVMTAGMVAALWKLAGPKLANMLTTAINKVHA
ncbi:MAG TPA: hypothetical protein VGJ41_03250 [Nocardioides sp.]|jgi:hypothetical protein